MNQPGPDQTVGGHPRFNRINRLSFFSKTRPQLAVILNYKSPTNLQFHVMCPQTDETGRAWGSTGCGC